MEADVEELIRYVGRYLLKRPDYLDIEVESDNGKTLLLVSVHEQDRGRMIGRGGRTAQSLRTLVRTSGALNDEQYRMRIVD
ncbi:MAG: KH domain-containing protein [bacterium]